MKKLTLLLFILLLSSPARAQLTQSQVDLDIQQQLQSCGNGCNSAASLRSLLTIMVVATFQSQGASGLGVSGTPIPGSLLVATDATHAAWDGTISSINGVPMAGDAFSITANLFGEWRFEDNGSAGAQLAIINNQGTGYGNTQTGIMSPDAGCSVPTQVSFTTNSGGQIVTVNNGGVPVVPGVCANGASFPSTATTWHIVSGTLTAGTGLSVQLVPVVFSGVGGHCASGTARVMSTDLVGETGPRFYLECSGGFVFGPGDGTTDTSMVRCGVGVLCINGSNILNALIASTPTPTVAAGQVGFGNTIVSPGTGTCPATMSTSISATQAVAGCNVINVGGTARNYPFF